MEQKRQFFPLISLVSYREKRSKPHTFWLFGYLRGCGKYMTFLRRQHKKKMIERDTKQNNFSLLVVNPDCIFTYNPILPFYKTNLIYLTIVTG